MAKRFFCLLIPLLLLFVLFAGCASGPGTGTPEPATTPVPEASLTTPVAPPVSGTVATPSKGTDLTNQGSPLAATFAGFSSTTPISTPGPRIGLKLVAAGLTSPMMATGVPDLSNRLFIVDQVGLVRILAADGTLLEKPFLDLRDRMVALSPGYDERGLLSMAFHPNFAKNRRFYAFYSAPLRSSAPAGWSCTNRLSEFRVSADPNVADPASERILLEVDKPAQNHNGGQIRFGPDGYLYLPLGDGGGADDTGTGHTPGTGNGQDMTSLLGKVLRISVDSAGTGKEYGIPPDNPFVYAPNIPPEIYASGFRNPAYASFDFGANHRYLVASAGQRLFESVYIVLPGGNYGWNIREGTHCFNPADDSRPGPGPCPSAGSRGEPLIGPIFEGGHDLGSTIVGGYLYRGKDNPGLIGKYIFGYWSRGSSTTGDGSLYLLTPPDGWDIGRYPDSISKLTPYDNRIWTASEFTFANMPKGRIGAFVRGFGEDNQHEIYVMVNQKAGPDATSTTGQVWKVVPVSTLPSREVRY